MEEKTKEALDHVLAPENQAETIALARALCSFAEEASDALMLICVAMIEARGDIKAVAEYLGFAPSRVRWHLQSRLSGKILRVLAREKLSGEGYMTGVFTLMEVAESQSQTGTARRNAALSLIELANIEHEKKADKGDDTKDFSAMTLKELESYVSSIRQDLVKAGHPIPAQLIEDKQT